VEVSGVDLSRPLSNAEADEVHQAYIDHLVIFFRDQQFSPERPGGVHPQLRRMNADSKGIHL